MALPKSIRVAAKPGETVVKTFTMESIPYQTTLTARISGGNSLIRIDRYIATKRVLVHSTGSGPDDDPPIGGDGSDPYSYYDSQLLASAKEGEPLVVEAGADVAGEIRFVAPADSPNTFHSATLLIDSIEIPIVFVIGSISVEVLASPVEVTIGQSVPLPVRVSISGPPDTEITLGSEGHWIFIPQQPVRVPSGGSATTTLTLYARPLSNPGQFTETLWVKGYSDEGFTLPFEVRLKQPIPPENYGEFLERAKASIHKHYYENGAQRTFGFTLKEFEVRDGVPMQQFARGPLVFMNGSVQGPGAPNYVSIRFVGFKCIEESTEASGSDEPYFLISAACTGHSVTHRFGPYGDVDEGQIRVLNAEIADLPLGLWPPVFLCVNGVEHDEGTPEEAEAKVRKTVQELVNTIGAVAGGVAGADTSSYVMPEWARTIIIGWIPEIVAKLFGMGDDDIGFNSITLWDYNPNTTEWRAYPELGRLDHVPYNVQLTIPPGSAGSEGQHELYFDVKLFVDGRVVGV